MDKLVIYVDWENLRFDIESIQKNNKYPHFNKQTMNYNNIEHIMNLIHAFINSDEKLKKIFFYTANPAKDEILEENLDKKWENVTTFLDEIVQQPYVATRLGVSRFRGYDSNRNPIYVQKQVDTMLGLDIAHVVYNKLADTILIFSKDIDIVPAMKCARINGITTIIANIAEGFEINPLLKKHSDCIRTISYEDILKNIRQ